MIPSVFAILDALPLTPNEKVDYRALPVLVQNRAESELNIVIPRKVAFLAIFDCLGPNAIDEKPKLADWFSIHYNNLAGLKWRTKLFYLSKRIQMYALKG
jgi:hypothetical protein